MKMLWIENTKFKILQSLISIEIEQIFMCQYLLLIAIVITKKLKTELFLGDFEKI